MKLKKINIKTIKPKLTDFNLIDFIILDKNKYIDSEHQIFRNIKGFKIASIIE